MKDIPIPFALSKNDRDRRGYPIPFIVYRDKLGVPHFTIDDVEKLDQVLAGKLCGLCGKPLKMGQMWMIGGPASAFLEQGMFTTPHAHEDCARYAVQVCPFLAAPNYSKLIEARTLKPEAAHDISQIHHDGLTPPRPHLFVLARTSAISLVDPEDGSGKKYIVPRRPWKEVEFWLNGEAISRHAARGLIAESDLAFEDLTWWPAQD